MQLKGKQAIRYDQLSMSITCYQTPTAVTVSFVEPTYTASESEGQVEVCFETNAGHPDRDIEVTIEPLTVDQDNPECEGRRAFAGMMSLIKSLCAN